MYRSIKDAKISIITTITSMIISSLSLCLIPLVSNSNNMMNKILSYAIAVAFWLGLIVALIMTHFTKQNLYRWRSKLAAREYIKRQDKPGVIYFSLNKRNIVIYSVFVVGILLIIADMIFHFIPALIMFPIISLTLLSFMLHCVFDGQYYKVYTKIKESMENETHH